MSENTSLNNWFTRSCKEVTSRNGCHLVSTVIATHLHGRFPLFYPNRRATEKKVAQILSVSLSRFLSVDNDKKSEARLLFRTDVSCASSLNLLGEEDKMSFRLFGLEWSSRWKTLSIYEK